MTFFWKLEFILLVLTGVILSNYLHTRPRQRVILVTSLKLVLRCHHHHHGFELPLQWDASLPSYFRYERHSSSTSLPKIAVNSIESFGLLKEDKWLISISRENAIFQTLDCFAVPFGEIRLGNTQLSITEHNNGLQAENINIQENNLAQRNDSNDLEVDAADDEEPGAFAYANVNTNTQDERNAQLNEANGLFNHEQELVSSTTMSHLQYYNNDDDADADADDAADADDDNNAAASAYDVNVMRDEVTQELVDLLRIRCFMRGATIGAECHTTNAVHHQTMEQHPAGLTEQQRISSVEGNLPCSTEDEDGSIPRTLSQLTTHNATDPTTEERSISTNQDEDKTAGQ